MRVITKFLIVIVLGAAVGSIGYFGYRAYQAYIALHQPNEEIVLSGAEIAQNYENLIRGFVSAGVSQQDALRGFWFSVRNSEGGQETVYMDVEALARTNLTEWQREYLFRLMSQAEVQSRESLRALSFAELPDEYQFHNTLYSSDKDGSFVATRDALEDILRSGDYTQESLFELAYLYELEGKYSLRDDLYDTLCKEFGARCERDVNIEVEGYVFDGDGAPIQSATITALGVPGEPKVQTDVEGRYALTLPVRTMEKIRVRASKRNYSDGIASAIVIVSGKERYALEDIVLNSPLKMVTLNTDIRTVTGDENRYDADEDGFVIRTPQSEYHIPVDAIVHEDGAPYHGEVDVHLYEFTRETVPESLLAVDTMDQVTGYAGDLMKTFGMPYIQFFTPVGEELHVYKSNPMRIVYRIYHMDALRENTDGIYRELTDEDMDLLTLASLGGNYPVNREFLIANDLLQFPAFWVFDRTVGVWENVGVNVLSADGLIESMFYTINNERNI